MKSPLAEICYFWNVDRGEYDMTNIPETKEGRLFYIELSDHLYKGFYRVTKDESRRCFYLKCEVSLSSSNNDIQHFSELTKGLDSIKWRYAEEWECIYGV